MTGSLAFRTPILDTLPGSGMSRTLLFWRRMVAGIKLRVHRHLARALLFCRAAPFADVVAGISGSDTLRDADDRKPGMSATEHKAPMANLPVSQLPERRSMKQLAH